MPMREGEILLHGHTHILAAEEFGNCNFYLNPGSVAIPKGGNPRTYMVYENRTFTVKDFDGNTVLQKQF
jgi:predicted phosphodiesterase